MKRFFAVHASLAAVLLIFAAAPALSQVHIGVGVRIGHPPARYEMAGMPPYPHAHWIGGHGRWSNWAGEYVWVPGHWIQMEPVPVVIERRGHVPRGNAWGYWRKHGRDREYYSQDDRRDDQGDYRDDDREEHRNDDRGPGNRGRGR